MKIILLSIFGLILIFFNASVYSQGCMDGGSDDGVNIKGFIQPQFNYFLNGNDDDGNNLDAANFTFNRARIGVLGSIVYDIDYYFFIETSPFKNSTNTVHLLDAFVTYTRFEKYAKISLGQFKSPFSLEQNTSCSGLYTINRTAVVSQLAGPQRDLGVMANAGNDTTLIKYSLGYMNGSGMGIVDDNINKDILGRLVISPFEFLNIGGSFRLGKFNPTDPTEKLNDLYRYAGEIQFKYKDFVLQAEYIYGEDELYSISSVPIYGG